MDFIRKAVYFQGFVEMALIGVMVVLGLLVVLGVETQDLASLQPSNQTNGKCSIRFVYGRGYLAPALTKNFRILRLCHSFINFFAFRRYENCPKGATYHLHLSPSPATYKMISFAWHLLPSAV
jgi:hypothetical protein